MRGGDSYIGQEVKVVGKFSHMRGGGDSSVPKLPTNTITFSHMYGGGDSQSFQI